MGQQQTSFDRIILDELNLEKIAPVVFEEEEFDSNSLNRDDPNVYNVENQSPIEKHLPYELVIHIMKYLPNRDIVKLTGVSRNFFKYWIAQPPLWKDQWMENKENQPYCLLKPMRMNVYSALFHFHCNLVPKIQSAVKSGKLVVVPMFGVERVKPRFGILGYKSCGKTTWINRFSTQCSEVNSTTSKVTGGAFHTLFDYSRKYQLELIEIGGYKQFGPYSVGTIQQCCTLFFCFDVSSVESFNLCKQMIAYYEKIKADKNIYEHLLDKNRFIGLIGMKNEKKERKVTNCMIIEYLEEIIPEFYLHGGIDLVDCRVQYFELDTRTDPIEKLEFPFIYSLFVLRKFIHRADYW